jgi:dolichyl-phosphate-mannose--protein O-mannosyl transferase
MIAGVISIFGTGSWQLHATSAATGLLAVLFCFLVCQKLFSLGLDKKESDAKTRAVNLALLSTFFMTVSTWHIVLSRTAFRANLIPLFTALTFYFLLLTHGAKTKKQQLLFAFLTGAAFAGGFYSYIAYRLFAVILAVLILWPLFASLKNSPWYNAIKQYWLHFILFVAGFILIIAPITHYFYTHPGSFVGRSSQVSIFNKDINGGDILGTLYTTSKESLLAYFNKGDLNWRHNISGYAFLSPLVSPFFALGLVIVTIAAAIYILIPKKRQEYWKYALIAGCFWGMLIPVVTTAEGIPHGLRSIGTIPWVFIISALGLYWVMEKVGMFVNYF